MRIVRLLCFRSLVGTVPTGSVYAGFHELLALEFALLVAYSQFFYFRSLVWTVLTGSVYLNFSASEALH